MTYPGEHLLPGQIGHFLAILSLVSSAVATISYFKSNKSVIPAEKNSWLKLARISFLIQSACVLGVFISLYYIISNHYHEYFYAWNHSSRSLQKEYLLASFWEGQEGSFMLWSFWNMVLGWAFIWRTRKWEAPVMTVVSFAQFCIATMLIGIYFFGVKVGSNPFILFREQMPELPIFSTPGYLTLPKIFEGNDLNTLLQNYWMVIHPPVLFLGFASTIIPFAFAYAGLINKDHSWVKSAMPWALFSAAVLGTGVMMGAAWAYESLSFGGYWAWDPVENASLVPWLILVAGLHTNLIYNHSGYSLRTTYLFYILSFSFVLYSTFLTRSGVLGDTSVHAFTGADMTTQLLLFVLVFFLPLLFLYFKNKKNIPTIRKEENMYSREFWMFIGSLVLFLSAIIISSKTSMPVVNKVFGTNIAPPVDVEFSYNQVQIFIALIIGILTAVTQYLKYKETAPAYFGKKILAPTVISLLIALAIIIWGNIHYDKHGPGFLAAIYLAIFGVVYGTVANAMYIWTNLKGKMASAGASIAHVGFMLFLFGVLISSSKKETLSLNTTGINVFKKTANEDPAENITLFKNVRTDMGKYHVTYLRDTVNNFDRKKYFEIKFEKKDDGETFYLYPDALKNNKGAEGFSANPDKRHYLTKDIFVYVTSWLEGDKADTTAYSPVTMKVGDTAFYSNGMLTLNHVDVNPPTLRVPVSGGETAMQLNMSVITKEGITYHARPEIIIHGNSSMENIPDTVLSQSLIVKFNKIINEKTGELEIGVKESKRMNDLMTLKVYEFPFITIVWLGIIVMVIGLLMSAWQRAKKLRRIKN